MTVNAPTPRWHGGRDQTRTTSAASERYDTREPCLACTGLPFSHLTLEQVTPDNAGTWPLVVMLQSTRAAMAKQGLNVEELDARIKEKDDLVN